MELSKVECCPGQSWVKLSAVQNRAESSWGAVLNRAKSAEYWVKLHAVQNRADSVKCCPGQSWLSWVKSRTELGQLSAARYRADSIKCCPGQSWLSWAISGTELGQLSVVQDRADLVKCCPGQSWLSWAMSGTELSQAECCMGQSWFKLSVVQDRAYSSWMPVQDRSKTFPLIYIHCTCRGRYWIGRYIITVIKVQNKTMWK